MQKPYPYTNWQEVVEAQRSTFFRGRTADTVFDRTFLSGTSGRILMPSCEALFTQSNTRVLLGQAANGSLRLVALPTQVYPAPTGMGEFGLGPGMYHHFDVAMYVGDLSYQLLIEGDEAPIDLSGDEQDNETYYADHFLPLTKAHTAGLEATLISFAPVAPEAKSALLAPAPLPGPTGAFYILRLYNSGTTAIKGKVRLKAGDLLVGHYEDASPALRELKRPGIDVQQGTLILTRPEGAVGIHLHDGRWTRTEVPFQAESDFSLDPGKEAVFETHLAMGRTTSEVMPTIYALHLRPALEWLNLTASFWRDRLGQLEVGAQEADPEAQLSRDIYIRCLLDNFNCLQTDAEGNLIAHWQGAPSHGYGTVWGIDVEPTAVSIVHICPELTRQVMLFFMRRSRIPRENGGPKGGAEHSVPILVAPVVIARQWLQVTGDTAYLKEHPEVLVALEGIIQDLLALKSPTEALFPSRYSSDGPVGRRYDYGTNVKVWYAFDSMAYILRQLRQPDEARRYFEVAQEIQAAVNRTMVVEGPFGLQISGGTNLGEDPGTFYLPEGMLYYDGEDTSSMLAPVYGFCDFTDTAWTNYHRFARSLACPNYDPEFDALNWSPAEPAVLDGTGFISHLAGSLTPAEMRAALETLHQLGVDDATGSIFWWPHGLEYKRGLTRCSQGQGAWAWQYLQQWLGLKVDANEQALTLAPRGLLTHVDWNGFRSGGNSFDVHWSESPLFAVARVRNRNASAWTVQVGFRQPGAGAGGALSWQTCRLEPGVEAIFSLGLPSPSEAGVRTELSSMTTHAHTSPYLEAEGVLFRRYGPALLWGHWQADKLWDMQAMPLAMRFVILNGTSADWTKVVVELTCPQGWLAQGRQPRRWTRPDRITAGTVRLELGALPKGHRTVAPFWVQGPHDSYQWMNWNAPDRPFHAPSQPGEGLTLYAAGIPEPVTAVFAAELHTVAADGREVRRSLAVPVVVIPYDQIRRQ